MLRIATYNIHAAVGTDRKQDICRIAAVIEQIGPDVIALQEVETRPSRSSIDQARHLERRLGLHCVRGPVLFEEGGWYGNVILSRWPVLRTQRWSLPDRGGEPRGVLGATVEDANRRTWHILNTHLDRSARCRLQQVKALIRDFSDDQCLPRLLVGDLNEWRPWAGTSRFLRRLGEVVPAPASFPSRFPLFPLDRTVLRGCRLEQPLRRHATPLSRRASDHLPIVGTITH